MAIDHTGIGVRDVAVSAKFYDAALGALGLRRIVQLPKEGAADAIGYGADFPTFWIDRFIRTDRNIIWPSPQAAAARSMLSTKRR